MSVMPSSSESARVDPDKVRALLEAEERRFGEARPRSRSLYENGLKSLFGGVPMPWMLTWPGSFPVFFETAQGARLVDVDGHEYIDFCLGDSAAMAGHSPRPVATAVADRAARGIAAMLPTDDSIWVGEELARRFGPAIWQFTLSASDANRSALRYARHLTGRPKVLVFTYAYHGTIDEALVTLVDGQVRPKPWLLGPVGDPAERSRAVEFNDIDALETELANEDVACVLTEPALTNIGIVLPEPGFHEQLRALTRKHGTLLIIDETHTGCAGFGGATAAFGLKPDMVTLGKWVGGGVPAGALGMNEELAQRTLDSLPGQMRGPAGVGGTVAGNALSLSAMRATLEQVLTKDAFQEMTSLADAWTAGVEEVIAAAGVPWHVAQLGCRGEYRFRRQAPQNGRQAAAEIDTALDQYLHLGCLNRGVLMTPFHNMALLSPSHTAADVARHTEVFNELVDAVTG